VVSAEVVAAVAAMSELSFLTPYWSGSEMMRIHLASLRRFHPDAPIVISKRGGDDGELEAWRNEFGIDYTLEDCGYTDAYLRLLQRCQTRYACILDHDTVLLSGLDSLLDGLSKARYDLVGIEERIRLPEDVGRDPWPESNGWLRFAPGCAASNFLIFDWQAFEKRWGLRGILGKRPSGTRHFDFDYGIGQRLLRHHYLLPFHIRKYGIGNLLKDGDRPVVWHQWYGSYRTRLAESGADASGDRDPAVLAVAQAGERAFIADYPNLALTDPSPAWGPERDVAAEQHAIAASEQSAPRRPFARALQNIGRWQSYGLRRLANRTLARLDRWFRLR
jgi:hypothetical protein